MGRTLLFKWGFSLKTCINKPEVHLNGRVLAVDVGTKRVGVAVSDPLGLSIRPLGFVTGAGKKEMAARVAELIQEYSPVLVVVGLPMNLDGTQGKMTGKVIRFIDILKKNVDVPIVKLDERLSSVEVERMLIEADLSRAKRKTVIDGAAAALILRKYLDGIKKPEALEYEDS